MKVLRIYLDTSVLGGCFDPEFSVWSIGLIEDFRNGNFMPVLSDVTAAEIQRAPVPVQELFHEMIALGAEVIHISNESLNIVENYRIHEILSDRFRNDMLHIALATIAEVDVLVSWNFKHIVRLDKIRLFNAVNIEMGYKGLAIYSPREVTTYGRK
jgi:hypothetical protein